MGNPWGQALLTTLCEGLLTKCPTSQHEVRCRMATHPLLHRGHPLSHQEHPLSRRESLASARSLAASSRTIVGTR